MTRNIIMGVLLIMVGRGSPRIVLRPIPQDSVPLTEPRLSPQGRNALDQRSDRGRAAIMCIQAYRASDAKQT